MLRQNVQNKENFFEPKCKINLKLSLQNVVAGTLLHKDNGIIF